MIGGGGVIMQLEERINNARSSFKIISMTFLLKKKTFLQRLEYLNS